MNNNLNILQSSGLYIEYYGSDLDNKFGWLFVVDIGLFYRYIAVFYVIGKQIVLCYFLCCIVLCCYIALCCIVLFVMLYCLVLFCYIILFIVNSAAPYTDAFASW